MARFFDITASAQKERIAHFYDHLSPHFRDLWGPHLHDGYYARGAKTKEEAQEHLVDVLAELAGVTGEETVIDIGCGMGATSVALAKRGCRATGVTLSRVQVDIARALAARENVADRTQFEVEDVDALVVEEPFDVAWMVGVLGHLPDPHAFLRERAGALVRPGGRFVLADWMAGPDLSDRDRARHVDPVLEGMLMPTIFSAAESAAWLEAGGFRLVEQRDLTAETARTWEEGVSITQLGSVLKLAQDLGGDALRLVKAIHAMRAAMARRRIIYGVQVAQRIAPASA